MKSLKKISWKYLNFGIFLESQSFYFWERIRNKTEKVGLRVQT